MWEDLLRVDWGRLTHAYGHAHDVPEILANLISSDEAARAKGWDGFYGAVNHQGDFYDSTVAAIPFLVEAVNHRQVPDRASIVNYLRDRWLDAPEYGGDPALADPPGGIDEPTPMLTDAELATVARRSPDETDDDCDEEIDIEDYRRMDLCAWQTGRAIQAGRPVVESLLDDRDADVAAAAAALLLLWPATRGAGKRALVRTIEGESGSVEQARRVLEFGVYAAPEDAAVFETWVAPGWPPETRAAAALAWAWAVDPAPLPEPVALALRDASAADARAFANLPWVGIYHRGPWILPSNAAELVLWLSDNADDEVRWRAVQGLEVWRGPVTHLSPERVVPVLVERLSDRYGRVREAAALALAQRGEEVLRIDPDAAEALVRALDDDSPSVCGHAARLLAAVSHRLDPALREAALVGVDRAERRFAGVSNAYAHFGSMSVHVVKVLQAQRAPIRKPTTWGMTELFAEIAFPDSQDRRLSPLECDRRLADAYAAAPRETIATAVEALDDSVDRGAAIGAAQWLTTLGPAAEPALAALDAMAGGARDSYAQGRARAASDAIRRSLLVDRRAGVGATSIDDFEGLGAIPQLERMLDDDASVVVGVAGPFELDGRLYHWREERQCPRDAALRALFRLGAVPEGDRTLAAMLAESSHAAITCGGRAAAPHRYDIARWRLAAAAAGGLSVAEPRIRAARQRCRDRACSEDSLDTSAFACEAELGALLLRLSGRRA